MKIYIKNIYTIASILAALIVFTACENYLTKEIDFKEIGYEPLMVLNSRIENGSDSLLISISQNINYAETVARDIDLIDDVNVQLSINGDPSISAIALPKGFLEPDSIEFFNYYLDIKGIDFSSKTVEITATHHSFPDLKAEIYLPLKPESVSSVQNEGTTPRLIFAFTADFRMAQVDFQDAANEKNYYYCKFGHRPYQDTFFFDYGTEIDTIPYTVQDFPFLIQTDEPGAIMINDFEILLTDEFFDGEMKSLELFNFAFEEKNYDKIYFEFRSLSESDFLFRQSFQKYQSSQDFGFFSEPTTLLSNIEGGLGVFSADDRFIFDY